MRQLRKQLTANAPAAATLTLTAALLAGCGSSWLASDDKNAPGMVLEDFVGEPREQAATPKPPISLTATDVTDDGTDEQTQASTPSTGKALSINAMVGHINGEAVYASQIFDINLAAQLSNYGRRFDGDQFRQQAAGAIQERLIGVIMNKLILGEAERSLNNQQRGIVDYYATREREEQIRFYGQGSLAKTKAEFLKDKGVEFEDHLVTYREELVSSLYIQSKVRPKISVTQLNIEHYYEDNKARYNRPDQRIFRILRVSDAETAQAVERRLALGEPFETIAADESVNTYNPAGKGLFNSGNPLPGNKVYGIAPVNEALLQLKQGEHAGPIIAGKHHFFTQLVSFEPGVQTPLSDVQLDIEKTLEAIQFKKFADRLRADIFKRGSFTKPELMGEKLLDIAYARYDQ